ncbi:MAG: alpha-amylase family glycosyl hydrolase, partial [Glutamicibacter sp.]
MQAFTNSGESFIVTVMTSIRSAADSLVQSEDSQWWRSSVIYQIYPKSFHSHAGNATGDLLGIVDKLDYLQWLGVDCLWITPFLR